MKKQLTALLSLMIILTSLSALASDDGTAYDAFATISIAVTNAASLDEVMSGAFAGTPATTEDAQVMAAWLDKLIAVTTKDMSVYAAENGLADTAVRDAYYAALSNVLDAQLMIHPESEAHYQDVKALLALQTQSDSSSTVRSNTGNPSSTVRTNRNTNTPDRNTRNTPDTPDRSNRQIQNDSSSTANSSTSTTSSTGNPGNADNTGSTGNTNSTARTNRNTNTPDRNTRNTPNTPDRNTRNTPDTPDRNT